LHPARLGQTFHGDYVLLDVVHVALTILVVKCDFDVSPTVTS